MLEITPGAVIRWGQQIGIGNQRFAELDYRIVHLIADIVSDPFLSRRLAFKGGTAINKLHLGKLARLSVDLDYNVLGTKDEVQGARAQIRRRLLEIFHEQDPEYATTHDHSWDRLRVNGRYQPVTGGAPEKIKVELSMVERVPITGTIERPLTMPDGEPVSVMTYPIDELLATKWRAFYSRSKGRDLFDLVKSRPHIKNPNLVRKMALYYFLRAGVEYNTDAIRSNHAAKFKNPTFRKDLNVFLRTDAGFKFDEAVARLTSDYGFMYDYDSVDRAFLDLSRYLLGKVGPGKAGTLRNDPEPLRRLFMEYTVSEDVKVTPIEELTPHGVGP